MALGPVDWGSHGRRRVRAARRAKRLLDVVGAVLGLFLAGPLIALAALAIKLDSDGPVFFRQMRCGRGGRHFPMWKLRTMNRDAERRRSKLEPLNQLEGPMFKLWDDPRVTRVGRVLRRFSVDELPQLWNVLRGEMSLVGPRPPLPSEVESYSSRDWRRLSVTPGLTGSWQVSGRNQLGFAEYVALDLHYIDSWSFGQDLRILLRTVPVVLSGRGAY